MSSCACPGCDKPGTNRCSACKTTSYCGPKCQTADWPHHKEECPGHLRKVGTTNLEKAERFHDQRNWSQAFHHSDLAANKLKQLKDRPVEAIDDALRIKCDSLNGLARYKEGLECAKERYCLYLTSHTHPPAIEASFALIHSCIYNKKYADAASYARILWETINDKSSNNKIPVAQRQPYIARGASVLARSIHRMAQIGGISPEVMKNRELEAISLARKALEIDTWLCGTESREVAHDMGILAQVLGGFDVVDDDEIFPLLQQSIDIYTRLDGQSYNVAAGETSMGNAFKRRAIKAQKADDMDRCVANMELALPHLREAVKIYRAVNHIADADTVTQNLVSVEDFLQRAKSTRSTSTAATKN